MKYDFLGRHTSLLLPRALKPIVMPLIRGEAKGFVVGGYGPSKYGGIGTKHPENV